MEASLHLSSSLPSRCSSRGASCKKLLRNFDQWRWRIASSSVNLKNSARRQFSDAEEWERVTVEGPAQLIADDDAGAALSCSLAEVEGMLRGNSQHLKDAESNMVNSSHGAAVKEEKVESKPLEPEEEHTVSFKAYATANFQTLSEDCQRIFDALQDECTEELIHGLRVTLRRLRSSFLAYSTFIELPRGVSTRVVSRMLSQLGPLRDTDVMQETMSRVELNADEVMSPAEKRVVEALRGLMVKQRKKVSKKIVMVFGSKEARDFIQRVKKWSNNPQFKTQTSYVLNNSVSVVAPSLLMPQASNMLMHPGWHIDVVLKEFPNKHKADLEEPLPVLDIPLVEHMHDLRKSLRDLRYNMELLGAVYGHKDRYMEALGTVKDLQGVLGELQDLQVLSGYVETHRKKATPVLDRAIVEAEEEVWKKWLVARNALLKVKGQQKLYRALGSPRVKGLDGFGL